MQIKIYTWHMVDGPEYPSEFPYSGKMPDLEQLDLLNEVERSREAFIDAIEDYFNHCGQQTRSEFEDTSCDWLNALYDYAHFISNNDLDLASELSFEEMIAMQFAKEYEALQQTLSDIVGNDLVFAPLNLDLDAIVDLLTTRLPNEDSAHIGDIMMRRATEQLMCQLETFTFITEARHADEDVEDKQSNGEKLLRASGKALFEIGKMTTAIYLAIKLSGIDRKKG